MRRAAGPLSALLALSLLAPLRAQTVAPSLEVLSQPIVAERDPAAAKAFIERDDHEALRRGDPDLFDKTFRTANELVDLREALKNYTAVSGLREALGAREGYELLAAPGAFEAWVRKNAPDVDPAFARGAVYEWDALEADLQAELSRSGRKPGDWNKLPFSQRHAAVTQAGARAVAALKARMPRTAAELAALEARKEALVPWLSAESSEVAEEAFRKAKAAFEGLGEAQRRADASGDPKLKAAVAAARSAKDPQAALERLGRIFDGLGVRNPAVIDAGPGRPDQRFAARDRARLADFIKSGVLKEMRGTVIGDELAGFLERTGMNLVIKPLAPGTQAEFQAEGREISLNQVEIERWLRRENMTVKDLLKPGPHLRDLILAVTPVVLHEGIHQQQDEWQKKGRYPDAAAQNQEVEANSREAAFILEKSIRDKAYRAFLEKNQERFKFVGTALQASVDILRDPAAFRASIIADHYPDNPNNEADAAAAAGSRDPERRADAARVARAYRERDRAAWEQVTRVRRWAVEHPDGEPAGPPAPGRAR